MAQFRMPSLGADMEAGTLVEWLVKPGDKVKHGDVIAVVETQKGAIEIEVFEAGQVEEILVGLHTRVPVGTPLARIRGESETEMATAAPKPTAPVEPSPKKPSAPERQPPTIHPLAVPASRRASPAARRLAQIRGLDLSAIQGSGPGGAIVLADVEMSLATPAAPVEQKRAAGLDLDAMRAAIAAAMARSKQEIPHYYLQHQADVTACEEWLAHANAARAPSGRLLLGALAIKSVAVFRRGIKTPLAG